MENDKLPYISVIIIAYQRKEFILKAITSVLNQTLDKEYYEIIVIKNFGDKYIDDFIDKNNIIGIISVQDSLGGKLQEALNIARGTVISFLEDDDLFSENKLGVVYKEFTKDNNIVYYHNAYIPINSEGKPIHKDNIDTSIVFNMSSISIKKAIIEMDKADKINGSTDTLMYLCALESTKKIIKGKEKLTYYMVHNSASNIISNNFEEYRKYLIAVSDLYLNNYLLFSNLFHSKKAINYLNSQITSTQILEYIFGSHKSPSKLITLTPQFFREYICT